MSADPTFQRALVRGLRGFASLLKIVAFPFSLTSLLFAWVATPILLWSGQVEAKAREWDPDLWARGGHTDLHPPAGAPGAPPGRRDS